MRYMITYGFLLFSLMIMPSIISAQENPAFSGNTEIIQDSRVDLLVEKHIKINLALKTMDGFRIQLFSDSGNNSKTRAQEVYDEILLKFPTIGVYLTFKSPNYRVRIGDFRSRLDAQRYLNEISADYPNSFIIADQINLPRSE